MQQVEPLKPQTDTVPGPVTLTQWQAARLALETRDFFADSFLKNDYSERLHAIHRQDSDKSEQICDELHMQSDLMMQNETNILFMTNRNLLLQKENYIEKGLIRTGDDLPVSIVIADPSLPIPTTAPTLWQKMRDNLFPDPQQIGLRAAYAAWATYSQG